MASTTLDQYPAFQHLKENWIEFQLAHALRIKQHRQNRMPVLTVFAHTMRKNHSKASRPFLSKISSSLQEGPPGFFVPASHVRTVAALVLMMMASTA